MVRKLARIHFVRRPLSPSLFFSMPKTYLSVTTFLITCPPSMSSEFYIQKLSLKCVRPLCLYASYFRRADVTISLLLCSNFHLFSFFLLTYTMKIIKFIILIATISVSRIKPPLCYFRLIYLVSSGSYSSHAWCAILWKDGKERERMMEPSCP